MAALTCLLFSLALVLAPALQQSRWQRSCSSLHLSPHMKISSPSPDTRSFGNPTPRVFTNVPTDGPIWLSSHRPFFQPSPASSRAIESCACCSKPTALSPGPLHDRQLLGSQVSGLSSTVAFLDVSGRFLPDHYILGFGKCHEAMSLCNELVC